MRLKEVIARIKGLKLEWKLLFGYDVIRCGGMCPISSLALAPCCDFKRVGREVGLPDTVIYAIADAADNRNQCYDGALENLLELRSILLKELL